MPIIGIFGGTVVPLYKGMMSQMVDPDERGKRLLFAKKRKERKEKRKKERASLFLFSLQLELGGVRHCFHSAILHIQVMFLTFFFFS